MINTQAAWDMFNELERVYFDYKGEVVQPELPFSKEFKALKETPTLTTGEHNVELARELLDAADKISNPDQRDKVILYALNVLIGKNIF